jgi:hypothetical protein
MTRADCCPKRGCCRRLRCGTIGRAFAAVVWLAFGGAELLWSRPGEDTPFPRGGTVLDRQKLLDAQTFWDNRDWDWYAANIPFFECPDSDITTTYYYRWEVVTKHLTYGSPNTGYTFTEFIDRPFWSGTYGAISCPAGHQLYEVRWLRNPRIARDYARYWFQTPGAQPRRYSTWLADAIWALHQVHPDRKFLFGLLPDLIKNYEGWEREHFVPEAGLFWQTGHDDGMEININSRQTRSTVRGAPGYRPTLNSYLWADALAIARTARLAGDTKTAEAFAGRARKIKDNLQKKLWDPRRRFFLHMYRDDEELDGFRIKALTRTYETGKFAGSIHGREEIGFVPWQFNLPDGGFEEAWNFLMDRNYFFADFGPSTVERHDPLFMLAKYCCVWSGQSWPYATTQTLVAMANLLKNYEQKFVTREDYVKLLQVYARTQRKNGRPYIAEACHPDTGSWEGHDSYNHSEHYFHSGYVDLVITGLVGLRPRDDDSLEVNPLAPAEWEYFALDGVPYKGHLMSIVWDKSGRRYGLGQGLHVFADGKKLIARARLGRATASLPVRESMPETKQRPVNFAVNNDGTYYPRAVASRTDPSTLLYRVNDGNYWYLKAPPNRWIAPAAESNQSWCGIDFGVPRKLHTVKLYLLDDGEGIVPPSTFELEFWDGKTWARVPKQTRHPQQPVGKRANVISFPELEAARIRACFSHRPGQAVGLTEFEAWGDASGRVPSAPPPAGNLALNHAGKDYPRAFASFTSRFDRVEMVNDGVSFFTANPHNRWTAFGSPNATDWVQIDFGEKKKVGRLELHFFDDRGGVKAPAAYRVQYWRGKGWENVSGQVQTPKIPTGGAINTVTFHPVETSRIRVVFTHAHPARTGLTELEVWER